MIVLMMLSHTIMASNGQVSPKIQTSGVMLPTGMIDKPTVAGPGILVDTSGRVLIDSVVTMTWARSLDSFNTLKAAIAARITTALAASTYTPRARTITIAGVTQDLTANRTWTPTTANIAESGNLYYTDARAQAAITAGSGISITSGVVTNTAQYTAPTLNAATRPINSTTWTISSTKQASVVYYITISCTATISGPSSGQVELQYSTNAGSTWTACGIAKSTNTVSLAVVLNSVVSQTTPIVAMGIPANALMRMVSTSSGTTTLSYTYGFETY